MAFCAGLLVAILWFTVPSSGGAPADMPEGGGPPGEMDMGPPPADVRTAHAQLLNLRPRMAVTGRLRELRRATVAAEVEGKILAVRVQEGDPVVGGETVLAEIDGVWAKQDLKRTEAEVAAAQATLDQSVLDLNYLEQLLEAQSAKPKEVDDMRAQVASDRASLSAAIAARDRVECEVDRLVVLAPFDGAVTRKITEVGQWVSSGDDIVEMISHGELDAIADVPEKAIDRIKVGDIAEVVIEPLGLTARGEVVAINPNGRNAARTFPVKVRLDDQGGRLKAGMSVTIWLPVGAEAKYLTVPVDAVMYGLDGQTVWVGLPGAEDSPMPTAMSVPVKTLFAEMGHVAVDPLNKADRETLSDGAMVVIEGAETLFPTQPLNDVDNPAAASGPPPGDGPPGDAGAPPAG
jgi:membrane fusion protein, multidrug efflux system